MRDGTHVSGTGRWSLYHRATREALIFHSEEEPIPDSIARTSHVTWGRPVCLLGMVDVQNSGRRRQFTTQCQSLSLPGV